MDNKESSLGGLNDQMENTNFGTKAETLERLRPILKNAIILPQIHFNIRQWKQYATNIIENIQRHFRDDLLVIRSSSLAEDTLESSKAGAFCSVLNVNRGSAMEIRNAIDRVIESYDDEDLNNQVLIQPQLTDVAMCGVMFTCDIERGAPYYVINYDESGATDKVTSGVSEDQQTHFIYRLSDLAPDDEDIAKLIDCAKELETITGNNALDIEFAFDNDKQLYLFQVRPLAEQEAVNRFRSSNIHTIVKETRGAINKCNTRKGGIAGQKTILSDMSDWNPAELIGSHPRPLSHSLFEDLITNSAWREARGELGYFNPQEEKLLVTLAGHPYVDVRNSFNSLMPDVLGSSMRERIINESLAHLREHPHLHDKVEFEVIPNCFTPDFDERISRLTAAGLSTDQIDVLRKMMIEHTEKLIRGSFHTVDYYMQGIEESDNNRSSILDKKTSNNLLECISSLLVDCRRRGTQNFSAIARMAFVGNAFLRSFVKQNIILDESYHSFLESLDTIAGEMSTELDRVHEGRLSLEEFLSKYGHLRPGTFDIISLRYDEAPDLYFHKRGEVSSAPKTTDEKEVFNWSETELRGMQSALQNSGLSLDTSEVLEFTESSILGREKAKFLFTRSVSDILQLVCEWGQKYSINKDDLSFLNLEAILSTQSMNESEIAKRMSAAANEARNKYTQEGQIILPELISDASHIEHIKLVLSHPNFITQKRATGDIVTLNAQNIEVKIHDKIVLIESADPGYDWIFTHKIRGLITKYGGAASHMAIRCSEFGLPAAIGVGARFDRLKEQSLVEIDCANHSIKST